MAKTQVGWAIAGKCGLYVGWHVKRLDMIAEHVRDMRRVSDPETSGYAVRGRLSADQSRIWERCKRNGDKAVKIKITYGHES